MYTSKLLPRVAERQAIDGLDETLGSKRDMPLHAVLMYSKKIEAIQLRYSGMLHFEFSKWICRIFDSAYNSPMVNIQPRIHWH